MVFRKSDNTIRLLRPSDHFIEDSIIRGQTKVELFERMSERRIEAVIPVMTLGEVSVSTGPLRCYSADVGHDLSSCKRGIPMRSIK